MYISKELLIDALKLISLGVLAKATGFFIVFALSSYLSVEHFAWWQVSKAALSYVLIIMEAGFYFYITLLIQKQGYSIVSVRNKIYSHRSKLAFLTFPFAFFYLISINIPFLYTFFLFLFVLISIFDYEGVAVASERSLDAGKARIIKNIIVLFSIIVLSSLFYSPYIPIFSSILGAGLSALILYGVTNNVDKKSGLKVYSISLRDSLVISRHFLVLQVMQTSMQSADLVIGSFFLGISEIAHYSIVLLLAEFFLFPAYAVQRLLQAKYTRIPNVKSAIYCVVTFLIFTIVLYFFHAEFGVYIYEVLFPKFDSDLLLGLVNVMFFYVFVRILNMFFQLHLNAIGRGGVSSYSVVVGAAGNIGFNFFLIPVYGLGCMPWITAFSEVAILVSSLFMIMFRGRK